MFSFSGTAADNDASNLEISTSLEAGLSSAPNLAPIKSFILSEWSSSCALYPDTPYAPVNPPQLPPA